MTPQIPQRTFRNKLKATLLYHWIEQTRLAHSYLFGRVRGSYAQQGEDRFLLKYFDGKVGTYLDVGANHPFYLSNTYLLYRHGWRGLTVEPMSHLMRQHARWRPRDIQVNAGVSDGPGKLCFFQFSPNALSTFNESQAQHLLDQGCFLVNSFDVEVLTLAEVYAKHEDQLGTVDLLCVDCEGMDLQVFRGNDFAKLRPGLIVCETPPEGENNAAVHELLAQHGYACIKTIGYNSFYRCSP